MHPAKGVGDRLVHGHGQRRASRRQDRGLGRGGGRGQDHQDEQVGEHRADPGVTEHRRAEAREDVAAVGGVGEADALRPHAGERLGRQGHDEVGDQQQHGRDDGRQPRIAGPIGGLLVDGDRGVPTPVDEEHEEQAGHDLREGDVERVEPAPGGHQVTGRRVPDAHSDQGDRGEDDEDEDLHRKEDPLDAGRQLDAAVADVGEQDDEEDAHEEHPLARRVVTDPPGVEEQEAVLAGHLRQAGHDEHVGRDDAPAAEPADPRTERPGAPREGGAAVRVGLVELAVADRDEEHGHEGQHHDGGRQDADGDDDQAEGRRQAVGGGGRGHPDDNARHEAQGIRLEALVDGRLGGGGLRVHHGTGHLTPGSRPAWRRPP